MNSFSEAVENCCRLISEKQMLNAGDCVVAGVSGGADSVFLFQVLSEMARRLNLRLGVAHLNHGLRLEAADELAFVRDLCLENGVIFHGATIPSGIVAGMAGMSIEMAARERRKRFLNAVAKAHGAEKIALGHTESDHTETVLMNIHRGSGLRGLAGIHSVRDNVICPLIAMQGSEIRRLLLENSIDFREDSSNVDPKFLRNRVRSEIIPSLKKVFGPGTGGKWRQLSENIADSLFAMKSLLRHFVAQGLREDDCGIRIERNLLKGLSKPVLKEIILYLVEETTGSTYFMTTKSLNQLILFAEGAGYGEVTIHPKMGVKVVRSSQWLYFLKEMPCINLEIWKPGSYRSWFQEQFVFSLEPTENQPGDDPNVLFLDENLFPFPFQLSPVDFEIDRAVCQERKIRDIRHFMKKRGFGKVERERMPVLKHRDRVIWIPGYRKMVSEGETGTEANRIVVYFTVYMR
ncbi:MAG: tRNA lysidine(34) synthetase TilS [Acidobacteria bacterium CG_4_9_14_3_um_filter_49_7]|nr:MAG: tRNA lysidine(34) synthetase TilS [Acidobacteria bacterium CG_4_9_14_3_um_filter_49_7]